MKLGADIFSTWAASSWVSSDWLELELQRDIFRIFGSSALQCHLVWGLQDCGQWQSAVFYLVGVLVSVKLLKVYVNMLSVIPEGTLVPQDLDLYLKKLTLVNIRKRVLSLLTLWGCFVEMGIWLSFKTAYCLFLQKYFSLILLTHKCVCEKAKN